MAKLRYFPFGQQFDLRMGTAVFKEQDRLVEVDTDYLAQIAAKRALLENEHAYYYRSLPGTETAQWDVLEKVLTDLARFEPGYFVLTQHGNEWHWQNKRTGEDIRFVFGQTPSLPLEPLDWVGRQVQEDLVILSSEPAANIVAGQLCFANGWSLDDKFGQPFLQIHAPAPRMIEPTMDAAQKLMERILVQKPVWRASWNFKISDQLDMSSRYNEAYTTSLKKLAPELTAGNIGEHLFIRIERQTISRLPRSGAILFGIHLYQNTLKEEATDKDRVLQMLNVLKTAPREMLNYKAVTPFEAALLGYLESRLL